MMKIPRLFHVKVKHAPNVINIEKRRRLALLRYQLFSPLYIKRDVEEKMNKQLEMYRQQYEQMAKTQIAEAESKVKQYEAQMERVISTANKVPDPKEILSQLKSLTENVKEAPEAVAEEASLRYAAFLAALDTYKSKGKIGAQEYNRLKMEASKAYQDIRNAAREYATRAISAGESTASAAVSAATSTSSGGTGTTRSSSGRRVSSGGSSRTYKTIEATPEFYQKVKQQEEQAKKILPAGGSVYHEDTGVYLTKTKSGKVYGYSVAPEHAKTFTPPVGGSTNIYEAAAKSRTSTETTAPKPSKPSGFNPFAAISTVLSNIGKMFGR